MALESEPAQKQEKFSYRKTWRQAKQLASGTRWRLFFMLLIACLILGVCYYALRPASVHVSHMASHNHLLHVSIAFAIGSALMSIYLYLTVFKLFLSKYFGYKLRILYRPTFSELVGIIALVALFICLSFKFQYRTIADQFAYIHQIQHIAYLKQNGVDVSHMVLSKPQTSLMWLFMVASFFVGVLCGYLFVISSIRKPAGIIVRYLQ